jgi:hypothetical protein
MAAKTQQVEIKFARFDEKAFSGVLAFIPFESDGFHVIGQSAFAEAIDIAANSGAFQEEELNAFAAVANNLIDFSQLALPGLNVDDLEKVLSVKVEEGVAKAYAPCLMKDKEGNLILQVGNNRGEVTQKGKKLLIGSLEGSVQTSTVDAEGGKKWVKIAISFEDKDGNTYTVNGVNAPDITPTEEEVQTAIFSGGLALYLREIGTGGSFAKLKDLPIGAYAIAGAKPGKYGPELILQDGRSVTPNKYLSGQMDVFLKAFKGDYDRLSKLYWGQDLVIISKKEQGDKTFVTAKFDNSRNIQGGVKPPSLIPQVQQALPEAQTVDVPSVVSDEQAEKALEEFPM